NNPITKRKENWSTRKEKRPTVVQLGKNSIHIQLIKKDFIKKLIENNPITKRKENWSTGKEKSPTAVQLGKNAFVAVEGVEVFQIHYLITPYTLVISCFFLYSSQLIHGIFLARNWIMKMRKFLKSTTEDESARDERVAHSTNNIGTTVGFFSFPKNPNNLFKNSIVVNLERLLHYRKRPPLAFHFSEETSGFATLMILEKIGSSNMPLHNSFF
ncbi:hypothetical protein ACJX0J_036385, partial [Zea mays]